MKEKSFYSLILPLLLFTMLGVTAFFQVRWSIDLLNLEQQRRTTQLQENTIHMANLIKTELFPLQGFSTQNFSEDASDTENYKLLSWVIYAHMQRIQTKELYRALYSYEPGTNILRKWSGSSLLPVPEDTKQMLAFIKMIISTTTASCNAGFFTMPNQDIFLTEPISLTDEKKAYIISIIDAEVFYKQFISSIAKTVFDKSDNYYFRIRNVMQKSVLFQYPNTVSSNIFDKPDIVCPLLPLNETNNIISKYGYSQKREPIKETQIVTLPTEDSITYWNVKTRPLKDPKIKKPEDTYIVSVRPPNQNQLLLEVVHYSGSLFKASLRYMMLNLVSALIVLLILGTGIGILLRNMRKAQILATQQQEFIATITHELKTPLAVISSAAQNMDAGIITEKNKVKQYGSIIKKETLRLKSSIDYFLMYSRINAGAPLKGTECDITEIIKDVLQHWEFRLKNDIIEIESGFPEHAVTICCDKVAITSVIDNLVSNAVKHAKSGHYLGIQLTEEEYPVRIGYAKIMGNTAKAAVLRIQDHGNGIPYEEQQHIFEPFVRGSHALNQQIEGSGVGLNLVKRITALHGGTILLEASDSQGSLFTIILPEHEQTDKTGI